MVSSQQKTAIENYLAALYLVTQKTEPPTDSTCTATPLRMLKWS